jgi:hypothetical protein
VVMEGDGVRERRLARRRRSDQGDRDAFDTHEWSSGIRTLCRGARTVEAYSPSK